MAAWWELGPVFDVEVKINARRWQVYAGRAAFALTLLAGMATIWWSNLDEVKSVGIKNQAKLGEAYFYAMIGVQLALTMIVAPAATAGAICVERARGSLAHMLVTNLTRREIVLGKLIARLIPTVTLIACAWPVAALGSLLGGINSQDLTMAFAITLSVGLLGCSMALALSAWAKTVHEVLMAVYTFWGIVLLAYPICFSFTVSMGWSLTRRWMLTANPFLLAFAPYNDPGGNGLREYGGFFGVSIGLSVICIALALIGVRHNPLGEARPKRKSRWNVSILGRVLRLLPGPSLDGNPVLWREWRRGRVSRPLKLLMATLLLASGAACAHGVHELLTQGYNPRMGFAGVMATLAQVLFGLLLLGVLASLTFTEERRRGSLDVLLATPLSTRSIVRGKWLGAYRVVPLLAIGPAILFAAFACDDLSGYVATLPAGSRQYYGFLDVWGRAAGAALIPVTIFAHGAWMTSLGLALSVWIRRESRAISLAVALYSVQVIVLPVLLIYLSGPGNNGPFGKLEWYLATSPLFATIQLLEALTDRTQHTVSALGWIAVWDCVVVAAAAFLFEATVRSFDRCFDRMPDWSVFDLPHRVMRRDEPRRRLLDAEW